METNKQAARKKEKVHQGNARSQFNFKISEKSSDRFLDSRLGCYHRESCRSILQDDQVKNHFVAFDFALCMSSVTCWRMLGRILEPLQ